MDIYTNAENTLSFPRRRESIYGWIPAFAGMTGYSQHLCRYRWDKLRDNAVGYDRVLGFSIIEILISLAIIGILTAVALPLYSQHIIHVRRLEAAMTLNKLAVAIEQYYTTHNTYKNVSLVALGFQEKIADNRYQLVIATATDSQFNLAARPLGEQAEKDTVCETLTLNSLGEKAITGSGKWVDCW
jgi:type IV pilus assembly protein PilE